MNSYICIICTYYIACFKEMASFLTKGSFMGGKWWEEQKNITNKCFFFSLKIVIFIIIHFLLNLEFLPSENNGFCVKGVSSSDIQDDTLKIFIC